MLLLVLLLLMMLLLLVLLLLLLLLLLLQVRPWSNPWLALATCVSLGLHCVILYVPFLAQVRLWDSCSKEYLCVHLGALL
jgi:hypothetical protein